MSKYAPGCKANIYLTGAMLQEMLDFILVELKDKLKGAIAELDATSSSPLTAAVQQTFEQEAGNSPIAPLQIHGHEAMNLFLMPQNTALDESCCPHDPF